MRRRDFLRLVVLSGTAAASAPWNRRAGALVASAVPAGADASVSRYGRWQTRANLPAFAYIADQDALPEAEWDPIIGPPTRRHWALVGNRAIRLEAANDGTVALFDEGDGLRWLVAADPTGSGVSVLDDDAGAVWGSEFALRPGGPAPRRTFGPTWFEVRAAFEGLTLERLILCPEGEVPWLLVRVRLTLDPAATAARTLHHIERWALRPRFLNLLESADQRRMRAELAVSYAVSQSSAGLLAMEQFAAASEPGAVGDAAKYLIGPPATLMLERLADTPGTASYRFETSPHPILEIDTPLALEPGERRELWFRFGRQDLDALADPVALFKASQRALVLRLPRGGALLAPEAAREVPWHAAMLTGGLAVDRVIGGHSLDQASTYSYIVGFNGAARDPLQHALPLIYSEPQWALSVLRNSCAWAKPNGDLPYALDGTKRPTNIIFRPSDSNLWALWLAAEYAAATGDLPAFDQPLAYHPTYDTEAVPLREHLRRQFRFFVDFVGRGEGGHVRILNADWNDVAVQESGIDPQVMIERGGSVLNSAMAAWVLPVFAGLMHRLGETDLATEARAQADDLRALVKKAWNGRWFIRAYAPGAPPIGDSDCWLEVQPWAILCGAADPAQARALLSTIDRGHRAGSPTGARLRWPPNQQMLQMGQWGESTLGGTWYAISMTLVWAAARISPALGWDEWRRMTLTSHTAAYPDIWEGTLSGPDSWNAPESTRPGRTWGSPSLAMQAFPVNNMHSHAQPLLAYLRLLGVEPTADGALAVGSGGRWRSQVLQLGHDGHGALRARGPVVVQTTYGAAHGGPGTVQW